MSRLEFTYLNRGGIAYIVCAYELLAGLKTVKEEYIKLCELFPLGSLGLCTARPHAWERLEKERIWDDPEKDPEYLLDDIYRYMLVKSNEIDEGKDGSYWWDRYNRDVRISFVSGLITELETFISEHNEKKV